MGSRLVREVTVMFVVLDRASRRPFHGMMFWNSLGCCSGALIPTVDVINPA